MKETEERLENVKDQKQRIRDRYKGVDEDALDVIPAAPQEDFYSEASLIRKVLLRGPFRHSTAGPHLL